MDTLEACGDAGLAKTYLERARELKPMLAAASDETERGREVTPEVVEAMKERGIFRMLLPRSIGGAELDPLTYTAVLGGKRLNSAISDRARGIWCRWCR